MITKQCDIVISQEIYHSVKIKMLLEDVVL